MIGLIEAKGHLRIDHASEDADLSIKLTMAKAIIDEYVGDAGNTKEDLKDAAVLLVLGELYANRESGADPLSESVRRVLNLLRCPAIA